ncbi:DNA polymerase III subunit beta [Saccharopolyspora shandongensis]|uniref:DNA polymerase III subunit beta n=1 Tax=Saccharopolyspora shandongensis TaxID=418495 RepID=UPI0033E8CF98
MELDLTAPTRTLAHAANDLVRLLPGRVLDPVLSGIVLEATADGVVLAGTDRERSIRLSRGARTHAEGRVLVPARPFAETLRNIDSPEVRLVVEGRKLALRTPNARFALPLLDLLSHPGVREAPPRVGVLDADFLPLAAVAASTASRDDALPVFTGVHVRQLGERLVFVGTDRFRMAVASAPWRSEVAELDVLVPANLLAEIAKQADDAEIVLHADADRVGMSWPAAEVSSTVLDAPFPSEARHLADAFEGTVDVAAADLAGAVRRVTPFAGAQGTVLLEVGDAEVRVRAADQQFGDAEEAIKATTSGDRITTAYQPRYLSDALQAFGAQTVRIGLRAGNRRSTVITGAEPDPSGAELHYVLMPKRT